MEINLQAKVELETVKKLFILNDEKANIDTNKEINLKLDKFVKQTLEQKENSYFKLFENITNVKVKALFSLITEFSKQINEEIKKINFVEVNSSLFRQIV
jgi:hypothetical protein